MRHNAFLTQLTFQQSSEFLKKIPFNNLIGLRLVRFHADGVSVGCTVQPELLNASGVLHGGVAATLADVAVGVSLSRHLGRTRAATTAELKINYLRPVAAGKVTARAHLIRIGKTLCIGRVDVFDEHRRQIAVALVTYMMLPAVG